LRETLFNILGDEIIGKIFIDAYAGSGAVGIEALSRGADRAVFLEKDRRAVAVIRENLASLELEARADVVVRPAAKALTELMGDIVFLDPPYSEAAEYEASLRVLGSSGPKLVVAEHASRVELAAEYGRLRRVRVLRQGDSALSFYRTPA
jgi:16S rRNA (guanine966-N2)-methyltransferase